MQKETKCRRVAKNTFIQYSVKLDDVFKEEDGFVLEGFLTCANSQCRSRYPILYRVPLPYDDKCLGLMFLPCVIKESS